MDERQGRQPAMKAEQGDNKTTVNRQRHRRNLAVFRPLTSVPGFGVKSFLSSNPWGRQSLLCLFISILSGVVIALQYNPATPYYATTTLELIAPFGSFWRSLHYYSSQAFFLLLLIHFAVILTRGKKPLPRTSWIRLSTTIPITLLLLFSGYILRGDATGAAAGAIGEHIALSVPFIGKAVNSLLFDIGAVGVRKVYINHIIGLLIPGAICLWPHLKRYGAHTKRHLLLVPLLFFSSVLFQAPIEPDKIGLTHITGPWFFLGLQELLRYLPVFWAGIFFPALLLLAIFFLPAQGTERRLTLYGVSLWLLLYALLSAAGFSR